MNTKISVIIPCLNEYKTIGIVVDKAISSLKSITKDYEVIVIDNGSTDNSAEIAAKHGAKVVLQKEKGYGNALRKGIDTASGEFIIMGDADDTYDFLAIEPFIRQLSSGADLVMGTRLKGKINKNAMPFLHRYIGNPALTFILNLFFNGKISDAHCGMRAFKRESIKNLNLRSGGMEFASEMIIKALHEKLTIREVPITYHNSPADRKPHLNTFSDGWRHLRFMLIYSPNYVFIIPGITFLIIGLLGLIAVTYKLFYIYKIQVGLSTMIFSHIFVFLGLQLILLGISAKISGYCQGFLPKDNIVSFINRHFSLEKGLKAGSLVFAGGAFLGFVTVCSLIKQGSSPFVNIPLTKMAILSGTLVLLGMQIIAFSFYISLLNTKDSLK